MRKLDVCDMEGFGRLESNEKTIAILGDRWWPQTTKQDGDRISKHFLCRIWKKRNERPSVGGVSIRSRNGAPSRKGCVVNGQMAKASNKYAPPPPTNFHHDTRASANGQDNRSTRRSFSTPSKRTAKRGQ